MRYVVWLALVGLCAGPTMAISREANATCHIPPVVWYAWIEGFPVGQQMDIVVHECDGPKCGDIEWTHTFWLYKNTDVNLTWTVTDLVRVKDGRIVDRLDVSKMCAGEVGQTGNPVGPTWVSIPPPLPQGVVTTTARYRSGEKASGERIHVGAHWTRSGSDHHGGTYRGTMTIQCVCASD